MYLVYIKLLSSRIYYTVFFVCLATYQVKYFILTWMVNVRYSKTNNNMSFKAYVVEVKLHTKMLNIKTNVMSSSSLYQLGMEKRVNAM